MMGPPKYPVKYTLNETTTAQGIKWKKRHARIFVSCYTVAIISDIISLEFWGLKAHLRVFALKLSAVSISKGSKSVRSCFHGVILRK